MTLGGRSRAMTMIIGCDFHPSFQQIAYVDAETGECGEQRLCHREEGRAILPVAGWQTGPWRQREDLVGPELVPWTGTRAVTRRCKCDPCLVSTTAEDRITAWLRWPSPTNWQFVVLDVALREKLRTNHGARFTCGAVRHSPWFGIKADYLIGHPVSPVRTREFE